MNGSSSVVPTWLRSMPRCRRFAMRWEHHALLVIGAVVVHHIEHRQAAVRAGPQHARAIHEIAIALDRHRQPPVLLVGERGARRRWRAIALAATAGWTGEVVMPGHVPQPSVP